MRQADSRFSNPVAVPNAHMAWDLHAAVAPDGSITFAWSEGGAIKAAHLTAGTGMWDITSLSTPGVRVSLPAVVISEPGDVAIARQEGAGYQPVTIQAAQWAAGQALDAGITA